MTSVCRRPSSGLQTTNFSLGPHRAAGMRAISGVSLRQPLILFIKAPHSQPKHHPKAQLQKPSHWALESPHVNLRWVRGGHTQAFRPSHCPVSAQMFLSGLSTQNHTFPPSGAACLLNSCCCPSQKCLFLLHGVVSQWHPLLVNPEACKEPHVPINL